jgi:hypothetical protein
MKQRTKNFRLSYIVYWLAGLPDYIFFPVALRLLFGPWPPIKRLYDYTQLDTPHSVGLLWTSDQPDAETST